MMTNFPMKLLRWCGLLLLLGLLLGGTLWLGVCLGQRERSAVVCQTKSLGPTVSQLQRIGELAATRIHVTDVMIAEGEGYRGSWLIKGDALLSCDVSQAKIVRVDTNARTATLRLPPLHVTSARVDHEKTRTWSVERNTWLPWKWGDQGAFRDAALFHAQQLVESAAASDRHLAPAQAQTELLIHQMYDLVDWKITVEWE